MDIVLSAPGGKPIYAQIYEQIAGQILRGDMCAGTKLPPIRTVARELRISVIPVKQAWEQLEREGFITTAAGRGTFVQQLANAELDQRRTGTAEKLLAQAVRACRDMGLTAQQVQDIARRAYDQ